MTKSGGQGRSDQRSATPAPSVPLPWLLRRVNRRYRATIRDRLVESGFGELPQQGYWALAVLARGGTEAKALMDEMDISKQAVSKLVDLLVSSGFVDREPHVTDRRRTILSLSSRGRAAAAVIMEASRATDRVMIELLGEERFSALVVMLTQVADREAL